MRFVVWSSRSRRNAVVVVSAILAIVVLVAFVYVQVLPNSGGKEPDVYVGVDVAYGDEADVYQVANAVKGYANLIVLGSLMVTNNTEKLTRVCEYLYQNDFSFIIYVGFAQMEFLPPQGPNPHFFNTTVKKWGDKFLGAYVFDEAGGKQVDVRNETISRPVSHADNSSHAAELYAFTIRCFLDFYRLDYYDAPNLHLYTSDYALYWYDYLGGYDVIFGEFVGNQSRQLAVSLCRGAARMQGKEWGTMITWKYNQEPFLESADELYADMVLAYQNQARYIVIFNSSENFTSPTAHGTLTPDHFDAMQRFWNYAKSNPRSDSYPADTAYVLPTDYGYGFRSAEDNLWGLWPADALAPRIWNDTNSLLATYGLKLDVVYETLTQGHPVELPYDKLIYWNGTVIEK